MFIGDEQSHCNPSLLNQAMKRDVLDNKVLKTIYKQDNILDFP